MSGQDALMFVEFALRAKCPDKVLRSEQVKAAVVFIVEHTNEQVADLQSQIDQLRKDLEDLRK
jgi:TolA-binding protein